MSAQRHVISVQADVRASNVKRAPASDRNKNYMPPAAGHAIEQAQKAQKTVANP